MLAYHAARRRVDSRLPHAQGDPGVDRSNPSRPRSRSSKRAAAAGGVFSIAQLDYLCATTSRTRPSRRQPAPSRVPHAAAHRSRRCRSDRRHDRAGDRRRQPCRRQRAPVWWHTFSETLTINPAASNELLGHGQEPGQSRASIEEFVDTAFIDGTLAIVEQGRRIDRGLARSLSAPGLHRIACSCRPSTSRTTS